jgi:hypothetical protein
MLKSLHKSPSLRAAIAFGLGGAAFAGGNLIFARILSSYEYGLLSLVIGVIQVAGFSAPLGLDYLIARRGWTFGPRLRRTVLLASTLVGLGTFFVTMELYHLKVSRRQWPRIFKANSNLACQCRSCRLRTGCCCSSPPLQRSAV